MIEATESLASFDIGCELLQNGFGFAVARCVLLYSLRDVAKYRHRFSLPSRVFSRRWSVIPVFRYQVYFSHLNSFSHGMTSRVFFFDLYWADQPSRPIEELLQIDTAELSMTIGRIAGHADLPGGCPRVDCVHRYTEGLGISVMRRHSDNLVHGRNFRNEITPLKRIPLDYQSRWSQGSASRLLTCPP